MDKKKQECELEDDDHRPIAEYLYYYLHIDLIGYTDSMPLINFLLLKSQHINPAEVTAEAKLFWFSGEPLMKWGNW
jgi:hypothetical protein